jgi:hypothetical protein
MLIMLKTLAHLWVCSTDLFTYARGAANSSVSIAHAILYVVNFVFLGSLFNCQPGSGIMVTESPHSVSHGYSFGPLSFTWSQSCLRKFHQFTATEVDTLGVAEKSCGTPERF